MGIIQVCTCDNCKKAVTGPGDLRKIVVSIQNTYSASSSMNTTELSTKLICRECQEAFGVAYLGWKERPTTVTVPTIDDMIREAAKEAAREALQEAQS